MKSQKCLRILAFVLASIMMLSLFACAETDVNDGNESMVDSTAKETTPKVDENNETDDEDAENDDATDGGSVGTDSSDVEESTPATGEVETSGSEVSEPEASEPEASEPETTESEATEPETTKPETTAPDGECDHSNIEYISNGETGKCDKYCADCGEYIASVKHSPADPDPDDSCNIKCTRCGGIVRENYHSTPEPDTSDGCKLKCPVCKDVLGEPEHGTPTGNWEKISGNPQVEAATCPNCNELIERSATTTTKGLAIFGADVIAVAKNNKKLSSAVEKDANGIMFARTECTYDGAPAEGTLLLNDGESVVANVGKYAAVLARKADGIGRLQLWLNNAGTKNESGAISPKQIFAGDGNWHLVIFDLTSYTQLNTENGLGWVRLDLDDGEDGDVRQKGEIVDIAYVGFFDSVEDANAYYLEYLKAYIGVDKCSHVPDGVWGNSNEEGKIAMHCIICGSEATVEECLHNDLSKLENIRAKTGGKFVYFTADCKICAKVGADITALTKEGKKIFTASELMSLANIQASTGAEGNGSFNKYSAALKEDSSAKNMPYVTFTAKQAAECCLILNDGSATLPGEYLGNYVAILYRKSAANSNTIQILYNSKGTTSASGYSTTVDATVMDGKWQVAILNLTPGSGENTRIDVKNGLGWIRLDILDPSTDAPVAVGDKIDIAYVGFFTSESAAAEYFADYLNGYIGKSNCGHRFNTEWQSAGQKNKMKNTCMLCGASVTRDCEHISDENWVPGTTSGTIKSTCTRCGGDVIRTCTHVSDGNWVATGNQAYEFKSTCKLCKQTMIKVCEHDSNSISFTANAGEFRLVCDFCGYDRVSSNTNADGAMLFAPDALLDLSKNQGPTNGAYIPEKLIDSKTSMPYLRMKLIEDTPKETYFWIWEKGEEKLGGVRPYFAFLYRLSSDCATEADVFISTNDSLAGVHGKKIKLIADGEWHLAICDFSKSTVWNGTDAIQQLRIDIFDGAGIAAGEYFDMAYAGFFSTTESATAHYNLVSGEYKFGAAQFKAYFDEVNCAVDGLDCSTATNRGDNNPEKAFTVTNGTGANTAVKADLSGVTLNTATSLCVGGWVVSPGGIVSINYRVVDANGTVGELRKLCDGKNGGKGILDNTASLNYGDNRANGGAFQSQNTVDLSGYEGKTVTVEVVIVNGYGQSAVIAVLENVSVPAGK